MSNRIQNGQQGPPAGPPAFDVTQLPEEVQCIFWIGGNWFPTNWTVREFVEQMSNFKLGNTDALWVPSGPGEMVFSKEFIEANPWTIAWPRPRPATVNPVTDPNVVRAVTGQRPR